jgi:hypothetical protein
MTKYFGIAGVIAGLYVGVSEGSSIGGIAVSAVTCGVIGVTGPWVGLSASGCLEKPGCDCLSAGASAWSSRSPLPCGYSIQDPSRADGSFFCHDGLGRNSPGK